MKQLRIISYNVNGLKNPIKRKKNLHQVKKEMVDITFIQESHLNASEHEKLGKLSASKVFYSSHKSPRRGVVILIRNHITFQVEKVLSDNAGRYVMVIGHMFDTDMTLVNVYNPPEEGPLLIKKSVN